MFSISKGRFSGFSGIQKNFVVDFIVFVIEANKNYFFDNQF